MLSLVVPIGCACALLDHPSALPWLGGTSSVRSSLLCTSAYCNQFACEAVAGIASSCIVRHD